MKKYIMFLLMVICIVKVQAQRMVYKQKALEFHAGVLNTKDVGNNFYMQLGLNSFARSGNYWTYGLEYQKSTATYKSYTIPIQNFLGEGGFMMQLLADRKKFITLNAGLMAVGGYEVVNRGDSLLVSGAVLRNRNQLVYGAGGRISVETYLSDRMALMLQGRVKVLWGTDLERFRPMAGLGFRFNF